MPKVDEWSFTFWTMWKEDGKPYAEPHYFSETSSARAAHKAASAFVWAHGKMSEPMVSELWAESNGKTRSIAEDVRREEPVAAPSDPARKGRFPWDAD